MTQPQGRTVLAQGRIVWTIGDLFKGRLKTEFNSQQPKLNTVGEQLQEYGFGLAVDKTVLNQTGVGQPGEIWAAVYEEAYSLFPSRQIPAGFAMKFKDGDEKNHKGEPFPKPHHGHIVFSCTTSLPIKYFRFENGQNILINEGIKCGDYVNVQLQIKAHPAIGQGKSGLYINPGAVQLLRFGEEIINAPSGDQIFGVQTPTGLDYTPVAPQGGTMLVPPSTMPQPGAPPQTGVAVRETTPAPTNMQFIPPPEINPDEKIPPHYAVLPPTHQPQGSVLQSGNGSAPAAVAPLPGTPPIPASAADTSAAPASPSNQGAAPAPQFPVVSN